MDNFIYIYPHNLIENSESKRVNFPKDLGKYKLGFHFLYRLDNYFAGRSMVLVFY